MLHLTIVSYNLLICWLELGTISREGQLVEHGDLLSVCKQAQAGLFGRSERERGIPNTLLITGSGVRVPHNPLRSLSRSEKIFNSSRRLHEN